MSSFKRWLGSLCLMLVFAALSMSCQVLFGDFKVGEPARTDNAQGGSGGTDSASGGANSGNTGSGKIRVTPTTDLYTSDNGAQAKFYVSLSQKPTAHVIIPILSLSTKDGSVSPEQLEFTPDNWNAAQTVTVTGMHDDATTSQLYYVMVGPAQSTDLFFNDEVVMVPIINTDNDSAGIFVTPTAGLTTTESGRQATFTVVLNKKPTSDVVIDLKSSDEKIGTVAPSSLTFTTENWGAPQLVTVTGKDDDVVGDDRPYWITVGPVMSDDKAFAMLQSQTVSVTNLDDDKAGVRVTLVSGVDPTDPTRLRTSETGDTASFQVVLNKPPTKDVVITVGTMSAEGTVSPTSLVFTPLSWDGAQTVNVVGQDDTVVDGNQPYQIILGPVMSEDETYGTLMTADLPVVNVINIDNDQANVAVTLLTSVDPNNPSQLLTTEGGTKATFSVALSSKPKSPVQFSVTSLNTDEGTVSPGELEFTTDNWNKAQTVTVTGVDDPYKDGTILYTVRLTAPTTDDPAYQKLPLTDVKVVNQDDDRAGFTPAMLLTGIDAATKQLVTSESGTTASFSISLTSKPKDDVKVPVASGDTTEGKVSPTVLTFTGANYDKPQTVTVTGLPDSMVDGDQAYTVNLGPTDSKDPSYVGLTQMVKVTNKNIDNAYIEVSPNTQSGTTSEKGTSVTFSLNLHTQPSDNVTVTLVSSDTNEGKVSPGTLLFSTSNWKTPQTVTVTGVDDAICDRDKSYNIAVKGTNTTDPDYKYASTQLSLVNTDDDVASLKVVAAANLQTTEIGGAVTFTVALTSQPTANVSVAVTSSLVTEGTVSPATLTFTSNNWATTQTVTVTGVDDFVVDGNKPYTVSLKTSGSDAKYTALPASTVSVVNKDNDMPDIVVTPTTCATTPGTTATFSVVLKSQPLGPVTIALSSDTETEGKVSPAMLSFTPTTWNKSQMVTVTGQDDLTMGMMTPYKIVTAPAVSAMDSMYNGLNAADVACINTTPAPPAGP